MWDIAGSVVVGLARDVVRGVTESVSQVAFLLLFLFPFVLPLLIILFLRALIWGWFGLVEEWIQGFRFFCENNPHTPWYLLV